MGTDVEHRRSGRILDPIDRMIEAIFGLVMVLTFTCTFSVESSRADVREMLRAALGCNVAWGLVDGVMYLVARVAQQMQGRQLFRRARDSGPDEASAAIATALHPVIIQALGPQGIETLRSGLKNVPSPPERLPLDFSDVLGAVGIFLIAVISVAPVLLPFLLMQEPHLAMRVSNAIAIVMLFLIGQRWAGMIGLSRWWAGLTMTVGGAVIVGVTIALGG